jgi:hypothetical protein
MLGKEDTKTLKETQLLRNYFVGKTRELILIHYGMAP